MATTSTLPQTPVPDAIFFELSPKIILGVRVVNIIVLVTVVITFILCIIQGEKHTSSYLLAGNTAISAFVGLVVNWWYRGGDLSSEKFWYILIVAVVLLFQCVSIDLFIFKSAEESVVAPTIRPITFSTRIYTWASFKPITNKSLLNPPHVTAPLSSN